MEKSNTYFTEQIMIREKSIRRSRLKGQIYTIGAVIPMMFVLLVSYIAVIASRTEVASEITQAYGTSLAASGSGGYVLIAVLAFFLGAFVAIFCMRMKIYMDKKGNGIP